MMQKLLWVTILALCVSGCVSGASNEALCDGTRAARDDHAAALATAEPDSVVVTGARLIRLIDAGCGG